MAASMLREVCLTCLKFKGSGSSKVIGTTVIGSRAWHSRHYDPRWRKERGRKVLKVDLPNFEKLRNRQNMDPAELRAEMKKDGTLPPRHFQERPINISSTNNVMEAYIPPEGDGKASLLSKAGVAERLSNLKIKGKSLTAVRTIKQYDEEFETKTFAQTAQDLYVEAQTLLEDLKENEDRLHELVTENAYTQMVSPLKFKTFRWKMVEVIEPPRVTHVRQTSLLSKENVYGQVTVRFNTKQTLAIYDRFGRLQYGSEHLGKSCLEYVVFEKHLSNIYGQWRVHAKIVPEWMPPRQPILRTIKKPHLEPIAPKTEEESTVPDEKQDSGPQLQPAA